MHKGSLTRMSSLRDSSPCIYKYRVSHKSHNDLVSEHELLIGFEKWGDKDIFIEFLLLYPLLNSIWVPVMKLTRRDVNFSVSVKNTHKWTQKN